MRVIAGRLRSRALHAPKGDGTRPTSDRVKEAMFSMLESRAALAEVNMLDLYAGSGALGIEALSRGAAHAVFVENEANALRALRQNLTALSLQSQALVLQGDVGKAAARVGAQRFQLVLMDPPYRAIGDGSALRALAAWEPHLTSATLLLEHARKDPAPKLPGRELVAHRVYGDTALALYEPTSGILSEQSS